MNSATVPITVSTHPPISGHRSHNQQIRSAALHIAEAKRLLLAQRTQARSRTIWLSLEFLAKVCGRLIAAVANLEAEVGG